MTKKSLRHPDRVWLSTDAARFNRILMNLGGDYNATVARYASMSDITESKIRANTQIGVTPRTARRD